MKNKSAILSMLGMASVLLGPTDFNQKPKRREPSKSPLPVPLHITK